MSSTYLVLKNNKDTPITDGAINSSMEVNASIPVIEVQSFRMSELMYLTVMVLFINLFFKGLSMVLDFLKQRWMQRKNGINSGVGRGVDTCASSLKHKQQKDIS